MTRRIFRTVFFVAISMFLASVTLFMTVLYDYFSIVRQEQLQVQTDLAAQGVQNEGFPYLDDLAIRDYRITWIKGDGSVLYDSSSDAEGMENHLERKEVREAFDKGYGTAARSSSTLTERYLYSAKKLSDGTILRLSVVQDSLLALFLGMLQPLCVIFAVAVCLSALLASRLSRKIVKPLNELDLDEPLKSGAYEELSPLLVRIHAQQREIGWQKEELLQRQEEFEVLTSSMTEGIVLLNNRGRILSMNHAAAKLLGTGRYSGDALSASGAPGLGAFIQRAEKGERSEMVLSLDGRSYQAEASPVVSGGKVSGIVLLLLDVTEKEKVEQLRREFTANVSHELKTPLQTISGSAELMAEGMVRAEDIPRFSRRIYGEAKRMIRLVEDILRLSHLDEGAADMKWDQVDLYALAEDTAESLFAEAKAAKVALHLSGEPAFVFGVRQLLQGIIYNLCDNAIKYNRPGGSVFLKVREEAEEVSLTVEDTGIGILAEHQERIFERFYRVDKSHSKEIGGTGLGLSIVKHAVKLHQAKLELSSVPGEGTKITIQFPKDRKDKGSCSTENIV